jgi:hypothetical protein
LLQAEKAVNASSFSTGSLDELRRIHSNIWLIAPPEVTVTVRKAIDDIAAAQEDYSLPEHTIKARGKVRMGARMAIESARNALSADLTGYNWPERKSKTRARLVFWKKGN